MLGTEDRARPHKNKKSCLREGEVLKNKVVRVLTCSCPVAFSCPSCALHIAALSKECAYMHAIFIPDVAIRHRFAQNVLVCICFSWRQP